jgi:hypothetical protein
MGLRTLSIIAALLLILAMDTKCLAKQKKAKASSTGSKKSVDAQKSPEKEGSERMFSSEQARREEADRLFRLAQAYRDRNQLREAAETMEEVADVAHDNPDAQYHAGMINLEVEWFTCVFYFDLRFFIYPIVHDRLETWTRLREDGKNASSCSQIISQPCSTSRLYRPKKAT